MEKFDLFKAIHGHPLCTRDGRDVLEFHYFETCKGIYPIEVFILGCEETYSYTSNGFYWQSLKEDNNDAMLDTSKEWIPTFKTGEMIEVYDNIDAKWKEREFIYKKGKSYYCAYKTKGHIIPWSQKQARPIYPTEEIKIDITIKRGDKILRPEDFSEETWSKLRK